MLSLLKLLFIASLTSRFNLYQRCVYTGNSLEFVSELRVHDTNTLSVYAVCKKNKQKPPQNNQFFSGPLTHMYRCLLQPTLTVELVSTKGSNVSYIDNWKTFCRKSGLILRDSIRPTLHVVGLISRNLAETRREMCSNTSLFTCSCRTFFLFNPKNAY